MQKITFHIQPTHPESFLLRFRLRDGDKVQLSHKTDIRCSLTDLDKFNPDGTTKPKVHVYNIELSERISKEYQLMMDAYAVMLDEGMDMSSAVFEQQILLLRNPVVATRVDSPNIVARFRKYADDALKNGIIGENRHKHIIVVSDKLNRFLVIKGISRKTAEEFSDEDLLDFRDFVFNEFEYVNKYKKIYAKVSSQNIPKARLSMNTVTSQMKMFQTFFTELEDRDEIRKSPFRKLGREKRKVVMKTKYDDPFFLRKEELLKIINNDAPVRLQDTRDAFLVQCAFGCRISDFADMSMDSIAVSEDGIPYVHYIPKKTADAQGNNVEIQTPIIRYAFDIIKRREFTFPILKNVFGTFGYNACIKSLLQHYKIERSIAQYNEETKKNDYTPIYKVASSKLARKTHVDLMNKVQVDMYAAGLHSRGSSAVSRYTSMELKDHFKLMNAAFGQDFYIVDSNLVIIG